MDMVDMVDMEMVDMDMVDIDINYDLHMLS